MLVIWPGDVVGGWQLSDNLDGGMLFIAEKALPELYTETDLWDKAFCFKAQPVVHVEGKQWKMFVCYNELLKMRLEASPSVYRDKVVLAIIKGFIYEMMDCTVVSRDEADGHSELGGRSLLFKRFIKLLSNTPVKPRHIGWYARELCVSAKYLSTTCREVSGRTALGWIGEYVDIDIRLNLRRTELSIKEGRINCNFPRCRFWANIAGGAMAYRPNSCAEGSWKILATPKKDNPGAVWA